MKLHVLGRKVHYWAAMLAAAPVLVIILTGLLLQVKKEISWVQPPERKGSSPQVSLSPERILEICRGLPEPQIQSWHDIQRLDIRPARGLVKITARNNWEVQLDATTGEVLQVAYRRSDVIEALHDGSWFHDRVKLWIFLPAAVVLLLLWMTGMYLFWLPIYVRWRRRRQFPQTKSTA